MRDSDDGRDASGGSARRAETVDPFALELRTRHAILRELDARRRAGHDERPGNTTIEVDALCAELGIARRDYSIAAERLLNRGEIRRGGWGTATAETGEIFITEKGIQALEDMDRRPPRPDPDGSARVIWEPPIPVGTVGRREFDALLAQFRSTTRAPREGGQAMRSAGPVDPRKVLVVHGRDAANRDAMFAFLRSLSLDPMEWEHMVVATGKAAPYVGEVLDEGFGRCQAVVVLLTGDDEARLREGLRKSGGPDYEAQLMPQPRQNVTFEAGMAMGRHPERTILVEIGRIRPMSDIAGRHTVRFTGTAADRNTLRNRLRQAGCDLNDQGSDWFAAGLFRV